MSNPAKKSHKPLMEHLSEVMDFDSEDTNFTVPFKTLTKKYGRAYIFYLEAAWAANIVDGQPILSEEEFISLNGNPPSGFFEKVIKKKFKDDSFIKNLME